MEPFELKPLSGTAVPTEQASPELLDDVKLDVRIDLGRAYVRRATAAALEPGAIVPLDKKAGEPVDVVVGERLIARGEVVLVDGRLGVRITELVAGVAAV